MFRATESIKRLLPKGLAGKFLVLPIGAATLALPAVASADSRFDRGGNNSDSRWGRHDDDHRHGGSNVNVDIRIGRDRRPEYCEREVRVWVPPVYKTVVDRKWVEPVYRTECEKVWVPPVIQEREVRFIGERGRLRTRIEQVVVRDGYYENRERRVCVSEGHWETCERQVLVCEGHYETRIERVRVAERSGPPFFGNPVLGGIWRP